MGSDWSRTWPSRCDSLVNDFGSCETTTLEAAVPRYPIQVEALSRSCDTYVSLLNEEKRWDSDHIFFAGSVFTFCDTFWIHNFVDEVRFGVLGPEGERGPRETAIQLGEACETFLDEYAQHHTGILSKLRPTLINLSCMETIDKALGWVSHLPWVQRLELGPVTVCNTEWSKYHEPLPDTSVKELSLIRSCESGSSCIVHSFLFGR